MVGTVQESKVLGGLKNEDADFENVVQNLKNANFEDWPNEAGFEGLDEIRGPIDLKVTGSIPRWAAGSLFRTGPGQYNVDDTPTGTVRTTHWFDGFGHSHRFDIVSIPTFGNETADRLVKVYYSSRRQTQNLVHAIHMTGRRPDISFGQRADPCIGLFSKIMSVWRPLQYSQDPNSENVCVAMHANVPGLPSKAQEASESGHRGGLKTMWLTTDSGTMKEIDSDTLEPIGIARQAQLHPLLKGQTSCAHAQRDPETGDLFNFNLEMSFRSTYRIFRISASTKKTDILATISSPDLYPAYIHSFFLSPSYVILCVPSAHFAMRGLAVPWHRNLADAIEPFDKTKSCRWLVVDRLGDRGLVADFESPAGFFFHSINSFEERDEATGDTIVYCDVIEYPTTEVIRAFDMDVILQTDGAAKRFWGDEDRNRGCHARLTRHKLRINANETSTLAARPSTEKVFEIKAPHAGELPTINPAYATKKYRYVYSLANHGYSSLFDSLVKTDLVTRETVFWNNPKGHSPGEAIFIPRPKIEGGEELAEDEDDGVIMSVVLDGIKKTSYLLCLDAKTMQEVGRADCNFPIAVGFHGLHWPSQKVEASSRSDS